MYKVRKKYLGILEILIIILFLGVIAFCFYSQVKMTYSDQPINQDMTIENGEIENILGDYNSDTIMNYVDP